MAEIQATGALRTIFSGAVADAILSADGSRLFVASGTSLYDVNAITGQIAKQYELGAPLGAIDLSVDGKYVAVVVDPLYLGAESADFFRIETATGIVSDHTFPIEGLITTPFKDLAYLSDGTLLLSQEGNYANVMRFDFTTEQLEASGVGGTGIVLLPTRDRDDVLMLDYSPFGVSLIYNVETGFVVSRASSEDPYAGAGLPPPLLPFGAISPDGELVIQGQGLALFDENLAVQGSLSENFPYFYYGSGVTFSPAGDKIYVTAAGVVVAFETSTREAVAIYSVGANEEQTPQLSGGFGNILQSSADGRFLSIITSDGVALLDLTKATPTATNGNDTLTAGFSMYGLGGDDTLGASGIQSMNGGEGDDRYLVDDLSDRVFERPGEGYDRVSTSVNFGAEGVEEVTFTGTSDAILYGDESANRLTSGIGNDTVAGGGGDDAIDTGDGTDLLDGGLGADTMIGGKGSDIYLVDNAGDKVTEKTGEGIDEVRVATLAAYTLGANVENLIGLSNDGQTLSGNALANTIKGGDGADKLAGKGGDDHYYVNRLDDVVTELAGQGTDTIHASADGIVLPDNVEALMLEAAAMQGEGNALANTLTGTRSTLATILEGHGGNDAIRTFDGHDTLDGGAGADTMTGGKGDDLYIVDNAGDVLVELLGEGEDAVGSSINFTLALNFEDLILTGDASQGTGNAADNLLVGNIENNVLRGLAGADRLDGDAGADTLYGGAGSDSYRIDDVGDVAVENAGEGTDLVVSSVSYTLGQSLERLALEGSAAIDGTGNALDNLIQGNGAANQLSGLGGDDVMLGDGGNDRLDGGAGRDIAAFNNMRSAYAISETSEGKLTVTTAGDAVELIDVEVLRFFDGEYVWDSVGQTTVAIAGPQKNFVSYVSDGFAGELGGSGSVVGTKGKQDIAVTSRSAFVSFDGSFNEGGDIIRLEGEADAWIALQTGSQAWLNDGYTSIFIPVGTAGTSIVFEDGARTLRYDQGTGNVLMGNQILSTEPEIVSAPADPALPSINIDPDATATLYLPQNGQMTVNGNLMIVGTAETERLFVREGEIVLDGSFNRGGDVLVFDSAADDYAARVVGSRMILTSDGLSVDIPVGRTGLTLDFAGDQRVLLVVNDQAMIDDQVITSNAATLG